MTARKRNVFAATLSALVQPLTGQAIELSADIQFLCATAADAFSLKNIKTTEFSPKLKVLGTGAGLQNAGTTCFLNAVLQAMTANPTLIEASFEQAHSRECKLKRSECGLCALEDLVIDKMNRKHVDTLDVDFKDALIPGAEFDNCKLMGINEQGDAHEFWGWLVNRLEQFIPKVNGKGDINNEVYALPNLFRIKTQDSITCRNCNRVSSREEVHNMINVQAGEKTLLDCLKKHTFCKEVVCGDPGDKGYDCSCGVRLPADKQTTLKTAPLYLPFMIKWTQYEKDKAVKIDTPVQIPSVLDLSSVVDTGSNEPVLYMPYAAVIHRGKGTTGGHYLAVAQAPDGSWAEYNDRFVTPLATRKQVMDAINENPYILFYKRVDRQEHLVSDEATRKRYKAESRVLAKPKPKSQTSDLRPQTSGPTKGFFSRCLGNRSFCCFNKQ